MFFLENRKQKMHKKAKNVQNLIENYKLGLHALAQFSIFNPRLARFVINQCSHNSKTYSVVREDCAMFLWFVVCVAEKFYLCGQKL